MLVDDGFCVYCCAFAYVCTIALMFFEVFLDYVLIGKGMVFDHIMFYILKL